MRALLAPLALLLAAAGAPAQIGFPGFNIVLPASGATPITWMGRPALLLFGVGGNELVRFYDPRYPQGTISVALDVQAVFALDARAKCAVPHFNNAYPLGIQLDDIGHGWSQSLTLGTPALFFANTQPLQTLRFDPLSVMFSRYGIDYCRFGSMSCIANQFPCAAPEFAAVVCTVRLL